MRERKRQLGKIKIKHYFTRVHERTQQKATTQKLPIRAPQSAKRALNLYTSLPKVLQTSDVSEPHQSFSENLTSELCKCFLCHFWHMKCNFPLLHPSLLILEGSIGCVLAQR